MYKKKELISLINSKLKKPSSCTEIIILINKKCSKPTLFRYLKKFIKSGDLIYICERKKHPRNYPTKFYMTNNLKHAKKSKKLKNKIQ